MRRGGHLPIIPGAFVNLELTLLVGGDRQMRRRLRHAGCFSAPGILALAFLALAGAQEPSPDKPSVPNTLNDPNIPPSDAVILGNDEGPLVIPGDPPDLIFEFTGKVLGYVEPCG